MRRSLLTALIFTAVWAITASAQPAPTTTTTTTVVLDETDSRQTRQAFEQLLRRYPPQVGKVLKLDPTLFDNEAYMAHYPALAAFVAKHPEVTHNSTFFLQGVWIPGDPTPEEPTVRIWRDFMEMVTILALFMVFGGVLVWLIKTLIDHRRWSRLSRVQADVHNKLLDRFASNEDLVAYIQTPAGKRFLESAPIPLEAEPRAVSAPIARILWSVQIGLVVAAAGVGLQIMSAGVQTEVSQPLFAFGVLAIAVGAGFVLSAFVSFVLSRKLGLWETTSPPAER